MTIRLFLPLTWSGFEPADSDGSVSQVASADQVVETMLDHMTNPDSQSHLPLKAGGVWPGSRVQALVTRLTRVSPQQATLWFCA